jgi:hypothetical protein
MAQTPRAAAWRPNLAAWRTVLSTRSWECLVPRDGVVLSVYVERADVELLRARAERADRSVSAELRRLLRPLRPDPTTSGAQAGQPGRRDAHVEVREHAGTA